MEWNRQYEADKKLLAHWLARKADAMTALNTADRQIEYLTNLMLQHHIEYERPTPGFIDYGEDY
jgi:hypothetical protein